MAKMTMTCPRCEGRGVIPRYYYNKKGVCFLCWGKKQIQTEVKPGETKEEAYARVRKREEDHMESQPPKAAIPEKFRNEKFAAIAEVEAFNRGQKKAEKAKAEQPEKTAIPTATKGGSIPALKVLPDYEGGPLEFSRVKYRGKKTYLAPAVKGEAAELFSNVPLTKTADYARAGVRNPGKVAYRGLDYATSGEKVLKDQYVMQMGMEYQDADVTTKITFNRNGEVSNITHYGSGMHSNRDGLDNLALVAFQEKLEGVAARQGMDRPEVKLVGDAFVSINGRKLAAEAAEAEKKQKFEQETARRLAEETKKEEEDRKGLTTLRRAKDDVINEIEGYAKGILIWSDSADNKIRAYKTRAGKVIAEVPNPSRSVQRYSIDRQVEIETKRVNAYQAAKPKILAAAISESARIEREEAERKAREEEEWLLDDF